MKTTKMITAILASLIMLSSCMKESHSIRFQNDNSMQMNDIIVGTADLGDVSPGQVSEYKHINTGEFNVSGTSSNGQQLSGSGSITGKGNHHWTIILNGAGAVSVKEDK